MKKSMKLTVAGLIVAAAGAVVMTVGACLGGASPQLKYEYATYEQQNEHVSSLELSLETGEIKTEFYSGDKIVVEYPLSPYLKTDISESAGGMKVDFDLRWWSFFSNYDVPPVTVKLPQGCVYDLKIDLSAGVLDICGGVYGQIALTMNAGVAELGDIRCGKLDLRTNAGVARLGDTECGAAEFKLNAGTVTVGSIACPDISADVSAGKLGCKIAGNESDYDISVNVSAGSCNLASRPGNGSGKKLFVNVSAGSANLRFAGA